MATFKVGQRVRVVAALSKIRGEQGVITHISHGPLLTWGDVWEEGLRHYVTIDGRGPLVDGRPRAYFSHEIAPLTDPKADAFLESIRQLAKTPLEVA
jgi:hypothetical protein